MSVRNPSTWESGSGRLVGLMSEVAPATYPLRFTSQSMVSMTNVAGSARSGSS